MKLGYVCQYFTTEFRGPVTNLLFELSKKVDVTCYSSVGKHMQYHSGGSHTQYHEKINDSFLWRRYEYRFKLSGLLLPTNLSDLIGQDKPDILQTEEYYQPATHKVHDYHLKNKTPFIINHRGADPRTRTVKEKIFFPLANSWSKKAVRASGKVVCLTENGRGLFLEIFPFKEDDVVVIPNSIDPVMYDNANGDVFREEFNIPEEHPLVVCVARVHAQKRIDLLVESFQKVKEEIGDAVLAVVGPWMDDEKKKVDGLVRKLGVEDIIFTGPIDNDEVKHAYGASDIVCLSSEYEPFGYCLLEAMCQEKPLVAYDVGGIPEIIEDKKSGYHPSFGDTDAFASSVIDILSDPKKASRMGKRGRKIIDEKFLLSKNSKKLIRIYNELTG